MTEANGTQSSQLERTDSARRERSFTLLVTGGTGGLGYRLVQALTGRGFRVRCLIGPRARGEPLAALGARILRADLLDPLAVEDALAGVEVVVHLTRPSRAWDVETYFSANAGTTRILTEAARRCRVERFVLVSSLEAAGPSRRGIPLNEYSLPRPVSPRGESLLAAERILAAVGGDMAWCVIRPALTYGAGPDPISRLLRRSGPLVPYLAPRGQRFSLLHTGDLVSMILLCLAHAPEGAVYFLSDGRSYSWTEVIRTAGRVKSRRLWPLRIPPALALPALLVAAGLRPFTTRPPRFAERLRRASAPGWECSPERARRELGFEPQVSLEKGLTGLAGERQQGGRGETWMVSSLGSGES